MIRIICLLFFVTVSWAVQPAQETKACKRCNKSRMTVHYDDNPDCRECLYKIYDELAEEFGPKANRDLYCGCEFKFTNTKGCNIRFNRNGCFESPDFEDCVSLEHVVPKSLFDQNPELSNNFHNLFPAILIVNRARQNKYFRDSMNPGDIQYGNCRTSMDRGKNGRIYPRKEVKGVIARAYLYMKQLWPPLMENALDQGENFEQTFLDWNADYPPDAIECKREKIISEIQGGHNTFISNHPNCMNTK